VRDTGGVANPAGTLGEGTVTLLMADVEGSTHRWDTDPVQAAQDMDVVRTLVRRVVEHHDGVLPLEQGEGDSWVAGFSRASAAVQAAIELQLETADGDGPRVRIGVHSGEVTRRADGSISGAALNRAARVRDLGHGGQILLSDTAWQLVVDAGLTGTTFDDLGVHELRGLARPERVWQLVHPDLRTDFPRLRGGSTASARLPSPLTAFVGRADEKSTVIDLVTSSRLLTLTGTGGCGKTRLAIEVARGGPFERLDGVWFVNLAPVEAADRVAGALAEALGVSGETDALRRVVAFLRDRTGLLVLDNCEHVIGAASAVAAAVLEDCDGVSLLVTSREPLGLDGERVWRVPSMLVPDPSCVDVEKVADSDAVQLFVDRAVAVRSTFAVTPENAETIAAICRRLDGVPLALELAAARLRSLPLDRIASGLDDRFRLLGGRDHASVPRQRTLEASVAWSYDLLSEPERVGLRRLAVFAGGFTLEAAEQVAGFDPLPTYDVLDVLSRLVDRSLINVDPVTDRYWLQETIRHFASDRLVESGEGDAAHLGHFTYYRFFVENIAPHVVAADASSNANAEAELHNIRAAAGWVIAGNDVHRKFDFLAGLQSVFFSWGNGSEPLKWAKLALADPRASEVAARPRAIVLFGYATSLVFCEGDLVTARAAADEALALIRGLDGDSHHELLAAALKTSASVAIQEDDWARARANLMDVVRLGEHDLVTGVDPRALNNLAVLAFAESDFATVRTFATAGLEAAQRARKPFETGQARAFVAFAEYAHGDLAKAEEHARCCVEIGHTMRNAWLESLGLFVTAMILTRTDRGDDALAAAKQSRKLMVEGGFSVQEPLAMAVAADAAYAAGDLAEARMLADGAVESGRHGVGLTAILIGVYVTAFARVALAQGDFDAIDRVVGELAPRVPDPYFNALMLSVRGRLAYARGRRDEAEAAAYESLSRLVDIGAQLDVADVLDDVARYEADAGRSVEAVRLSAAADATRTRCGAVVRIPDRPARDVLHACLRVALGDDAFESAYAEGAAMATDEAARYAARGRGKRQRPRAGWNSLTPSELRVIDLVVGGANNADIADRLFVSRNTVKTHLTHIFTKLGIATRTELAAEAVRRTDLPAVPDGTP